MSVVDKVIEWLKNANKEERGVFIDQLIKEKELYETLQQAGLSPAISDPQTAAALRPQGLLSKDTVVQVQDLIGFKEIIQNGGAEDGFAGWSLVESPTIDTTFMHTGAKCFKLTYPAMGAGSGIIQDLPPIRSDGIVHSFWHNTTSGKRFGSNITYLDGSYESFIDWGDGTYRNPSWTLASGKYLKNIYLRPIGDGNTAYLDDVSLLMKGAKLAYIPLEQAVRSVLRVMCEREDLLLETKSAWVFGGVGAADILAAVASKRHKVYALGYLNGATATKTRFKATVASAVKYWGARNTAASFFAQTLINPIVCDENTAFAFDVAGACTVEEVFVQYKTE